MSKSKSKSKIMVVDDDAFIRRPLEFILRAEGFETVMVEDGNACLSQVPETSPDLIILDIMMPGCDGFEVCRTIKSDPQLAQIPIILLSARCQGPDRERGLALGAADYMTKPYSPSELISRIRELLSDN